MKGHAIECRVNAEDPVTFAPPQGLITAYNRPAGWVCASIRRVRAVPVFAVLRLDGAKLIVFGDSRPAAIMRMRRALEEYIVEGIKTNIPFHKSS